MQLAVCSFICYLLTKHLVWGERWGGRGGRSLWRQKMNSVMHLPSRLGLLVQCTINMAEHKTATWMCLQHVEFSLNISPNSSPPPPPMLSSRSVLAISLKRIATKNLAAFLSCPSQRYLPFLIEFDWKMSALRLSNVPFWPSHFPWD